MSGEMRVCPKCGNLWVWWNGMSRHWLCLGAGCNYSAPPDLDRLTDYEKARAYDKLQPRKDTSVSDLRSTEREMTPSERRVYAVLLANPFDLVISAVKIAETIDELEKQRDELQAKVAALEADIENRDSCAQDLDTLT